MKKKQKKHFVICDGFVPMEKDGRLLIYADVAAASDDWTLLRGIKAHQSKWLMVRCCTVKVSRLP